MHLNDGWYGSQQNCTGNTRAGTVISTSVPVTAQNKKQYNHILAHGMKLNKRKEHQRKTIYPYAFS